MMASGMDPFLAMAVGLLAGLVMGIVNGIIIAKGKVAPFIATLATMTIFRGLTLVYMDGRPITGLGDHLMFQMFETRLFSWYSGTSCYNDDRFRSTVLHFEENDIWSPYICNWWK